MSPLKWRERPEDPDASKLFLFATGYRFLPNNCALNLRHGWTACRASGIGLAAKREVVHAEQLNKDVSTVVEQVTNAIVSRSTHQASTRPSHTETP